MLGKIVGHGSENMALTLEDASGEQADVACQACETASCADYETALRKYLAGGLDYF